MAISDERDALLPFPDPRSHLSLHLLRVGVCAERWQALRARGDDGALAQIDARLSAIDAELAARERLSDRSQLPLLLLQDRFGLADPVLHFLVAAAAPGIDLVLGRALCDLAGGAAGPRQPDVGFLLDLVALDEVAYHTLIAALSEVAPLLRHRLVRLATPRGWVPEGPTLLAPVAVPQRVLAWLRGELSFEGVRFARSARLVRGADGASLSEPLRAGLERALFHEENGRPAPLVVVGPALSGKASAVRLIAASRELPVLEVDLEALVVAPQASEVLEDLVREARLQGAVLLLRHADALDDKQAELRRAVATLLGDEAVSLRVVLTGRGTPEELLRLARGLRTFRHALPAEAEQAVLWERALPPHLPRAEDLDVGSVVRRYRLTPGDILEAGAAAGARAVQRDGARATITLDDVVHAVRERLSHRLGDVADLVTTSMQWTDVVLAPELVDRINEIIASYDNERLVIEEWGFGGRFSYGRALTALFAGPPGTGKTMVAALIAKELGLELFRVDLSRTVSKWVGETEKNLGLAFDEAKSAQAVLLFDEADSLFAKRTEVKSSNDRYANLEVNYLLQRIEAFEGIVLLTTNKESAIDEAFRRRIRFRVTFAAPGEEERELLWRSMIPEAAPLAGDVDFAALAKRFRMAGGNIKNAVMRAAFLAASTPEQLITHDLLSRAATHEWEEMGKLTPA